MIYNGKITFESNSGSISWLDQLDLKHELYFVIKAYNNWYDEVSNPYVYVYNSDNLVFKTKIRLEDFSVNNGEAYDIYAANPHFVFAHSNGEQLYVITKGTGTGLLHEWAIQTIDFE